MGDADMSASVTWEGFEFTPFRMDTTTWNDVGGVYMFATLSADGVWIVFYVGKAESFAARMPTHERWLEARTLGATHVLATVVALEATRVSLERRSIELLRPVMNVQHNPSPHRR
jgi:hypothetical protein